MVSKSLVNALNKSPEDSLSNVSETARKCTDRQREIVDYLVSTGQSVPEAAKSLEINAQNIYRELRKPHVISYIHEAIQREIGPSALSALGTMKSLLKSRSDKVRFDAAADLLDRAGFKAPEQKIVRGHIKVDIDLG